MAVVKGLCHLAIQPYTDVLDIDPTPLPISHPQFPVENENCSHWQ